ncbi:MAG: exodeoxyribonuclease VII small subunit [Paludibacteraceae bacterium]
MPKQKLNYTNAIAELEKILFELENNTEINIEQISGNVKRASELLNICRNQLYLIDTELEKALESID